MGEEWRTLTFGNLRPGDVIRTDQELPDIETVEAVAWPWVHPDFFRFTTNHGWAYAKRAGDPVLVRHPRPQGDKS